MGDLFGGGARAPQLPAPVTPAPTQDDPATKVKTDAAAAAARALAQARGGAPRNILSVRPKVGPPRLSLLGGGQV
jgi:hypothetical protein